VCRRATQQATVHAVVDFLAQRWAQTSTSPYAQRFRIERAHRGQATCSHARNILLLKHAADGRGCATITRKKMIQYHVLSLHVESCLIKCWNNHWKCWMLKNIRMLNILQNIDLFSANVETRFFLKCWIWLDLLVRLMALKPGYLSGTWRPNMSLII
jgi:hypothetical protein